MSYSRLILKDSPEIVWPFDDVTESSSISLPIQFTSYSASTYAASIVAASTNVIDVPIIFGGGTAMNLLSSSSAIISVPLLNRLSELYSQQSYAIEFWLKIDNAVPEEITICKKRGFNNIGLFLKENYLIYRYGNSSSYYEVSYGLGTLSEPTHIVMNYSPNTLSLIVNGVMTQSSLPTQPLDSTSNTASLNYLDFYGSASYDFIVDCVAIYPYALSPNVAKKHYIYGVGKNVQESIFFTLGGDYYNFSTDSTRKSYFQYWDYPDEWQLIRYDNLIHTPIGVKNRYFTEPEIYFSDSNVSTASNKIKFSSSAGNTQGSYLDFNNMNEFLPDGYNMFFVKVTFDGELPSSLNSQTIMTYGIPVFNRLVEFNLYNNSGSYILNILNNIDSTTSSFSIPDITSSPTAYIGMQYLSNAVYYFALSGSALQSSSYTSSAYYIERLNDYFPPPSESTIRIGSNFTFDSKSDLDNTKSPNQFYGTFHKFLSLNAAFSASTYSEIDSASQVIYSAEYNSSLSRFKIKSYGNANFIIHGAKLSQVNNSSSAVTVANRFEFGYPDVISGSQVKIYSTLYNYSGSVIHAKTAASYINHFDWLNYTDLTDKYLRFDIDIIGEDINYYPPVIKYFKAETYPYISGSYVEILDNGGDKIKIYSSASGHTYIPEFDETPSIYLTHTSGIKISKNLVDIEFSPKEDNINVGTMTDLLVWLDSRFPKGRELLPYSDSSSGVWFNSKSSSYSGSASAAALYPEYRVQSANMLKLNYSNGGEDGTTTGITASAASVSVSPDGVVSGNKSFKITPNGTSNNSYIYFDSNTGASFVGGLFSNGTYTAVATITLNKIQESSSLNSNARRLVIIPYISTASQTAIVSNQAPNEIGSHSLSVTFSLSSSITGATIRLMNGSASANDIVFYDNIGIYSGSSASLEWELPLSTYDDRPVFKFDGASELLSSSISLSQPMTIYAIVRGFDDNNAFIGRSASAPSLYSSAGYYRMYAGTELVSASPITSSFTTLVGVFNGATSSLYVNNSIVSGDVGSGSITNYIDIGHRFNQDGIEQYLKGDVAGILIFNTAHSASTVQNIREWIVDAFNM